jgi:hypothetical protein
VRRALAAGLLALVVGAAAGAQSVRSSGVGTAPLPGAPGVPPRAAALEAALANAVERVAAELAGGAEGKAAEAALREALGPNPGRFALSYRSVSEIERARAQAPGREIAVTIEAQVDRTRVEGALRRAGLLAEQAAPPRADGAHRIVVEPLPSWPALTALRRRLEELGAEIQSGSSPSGPCWRSRGGAAPRASSPSSSPLRPPGSRSNAPAIATGRPPSVSRASRRKAATRRRRLTPPRRKGNWIRPLRRFQARSSAG